MQQQQPGTLKDCSVSRKKSKKPKLATLCRFYVLQLPGLFRLDTIPSANLRQQKLEQQRLRIEQKQKQKRETGKLIQASDLKSASSVKRGGRPLSGRKELHGYEGPLQFLHGANPDEMTTVQVHVWFGFKKNMHARLRHFLC